MSKIRWWALPCGALLTAATLTAPAMAGPALPSQVRDGASQPDFTAAPISETVWVDTGIDGDNDGVNDRVAADIRRPAGTDQKVPVIMDASPYYSSAGRGNEKEMKTYDDQGRPVGFPLNYDNYFVPRGYATVLVDLAGTNRSEGCVDVGAQSDVGSAKAVIDWLNGRAEGYRTPEGGEKVAADWTTGATGMIGKSWDGTIANGVAATGVEGLNTIVPIAAISSWYDYYRSHGTNFDAFGSPANLANMVEEGTRTDCDHVKQQLDQGTTPDGNMTPMWDARNYVPSAANVKASVFAVHGMGDLNVKMMNFGQWWTELAKNDVKRKVWLSQTGHVDPFDFRRKEWVETLHRWFDHTLLGVDNGVDTEPAATIERAPDQWVDEPTWAADQAQAQPTTMYPKPGSTPGVGQLGPEPAGAQDVASFTDDPRQSEYDWAAAPDQANGARALFSTSELQQDLRLAGTSTITVKATPSTRSAHVSAVLVDYGPTTHRDYLGDGEGIRTLTTESCFGENFAGDDACYRDTAATTTDVDFEVVSRGWADLSNYQSLTENAPLEPGKPYDLTFRLAATDHVVPAGHRLALIIGGTDAAYTSSPQQPGAVDLALAGTSIQLPIVGGAPAAQMAGTNVPATEPPHVRPNRIPAEPQRPVQGDNLRP